MCEFLYHRCRADSNIDQKNTRDITRFSSSSPEWVGKTSLEHGSIEIMTCTRPLGATLEPIGQKAQCCDWIDHCKEETYLSVRSPTSNQNHPQQPVKRLVRPEILLFKSSRQRPMTNWGLTVLERALGEKPIKEEQFSNGSIDKTLYTASQFDKIWLENSWCLFSPNLKGRTVNFQS